MHEFNFSEGDDDNDENLTASIDETLNVGNSDQNNDSKMNNIDGTNGGEGTQNY